MLRILIDVECVTGGHHALIILNPTGIHYTAQAGGMCCEHPEVEGFVMALHPDRFKHFGSTCDYGCWGGEDWSEEQRKEAATKLDSLLCHVNDSEFSPSTYASISLRFDWDRLDQLMENWWPVIVNVDYFDIMENNDDKPPLPIDYRGIVCTGNCD